MSPKKLTTDWVRERLLNSQDDQVVKKQKAALQALKELIDGDNLMLAAKAVRVVGLMGLDESVRIVAEAAKSRKPMLRLVAATIAPQLKDKARPILEHLLKSKDPSLLKWAMRSAQEIGMRPPEAVSNEG